MPIFRGRLGWLTNRRPGGRRLRLTVGLFAALLLPTVALAYLSIRSVRGEAAEARQLLEVSYRRVADVVTAQIDAEIEQRDRTLVRRIGSGRPDLQTVLERLHEAERNDPVLRPLVLLEESGIVLYPSRGWPVPGLSSRAGRRGDSREFGPAFAAAEESELREGRPAAASRLYAAAVETASTDDEFLRALNGLARCELKAGRPVPAARAYERLIAAASALAPAQVGRGIVARHQLISCYQALGDQDGAAAAALDLYAALLEARFLVEEDFYGLYRSLLAELLEGQAPVSLPPARFDELRDRESELAQALSFLDSVSAVAARFPPAPPGGSRTVPAMEYAGLPGGAGVVAISSLDLEGEAGGDLRLRLARRWSTDELTAVARRILSESGRSSDLGIGVLAADGVPVNASVNEAPAAQIAAGTALQTAPGWRVVAFPVSGSLEELAARDTRRYAVLMILVVGTVVVGLTLAARSVSHEVALARLRAEFVSSVSHELKTPLALIRVFAENLSSQWVAEDKKAGYYEVIRRESERLTALINNVLDFSRIEAGTQSYELVDLDLRELTADILERYRLHLKKSGVELTTDL
ncbi:MAG: hypothetical protein O7A04_06530 [Acidobacteria bacterium]|nr:hypothetical protein [Acidobacteriota bacterium]